MESEDSSVEEAPRSEPVRQIRPCRQSSEFLLQRQRLFYRLDNASIFNYLRLSYVSHLLIFCMLEGENIFLRH
jgi:hypothetical protein